MAAILKAFENVEVERKKLPEILEKASKEHAGMFLFRSYKTGAEKEFILKNGYVLFKGKTNTGRTAGKLDYKEFSEEINMDELREVGLRLSKYGY